MLCRLPVAGFSLLQICPAALLCCCRHLYLHQLELDHQSCCHQVSAMLLLTISLLMDCELLLVLLRPEDQACPSSGRSFRTSNCFLPQWSLRTRLVPSFCRSCWSVNCFSLHWSQAGLSSWRASAWVLSPSVVCVLCHPLGLFARVTLSLCVSLALRWPFWQLGAGPARCPDSPRHLWLSLHLDNLWHVHSWIFRISHTTCLCRLSRSCSAWRSCHSQCTSPLCKPCCRSTTRTLTLAFDDAMED